jgi:hypothetical protein
MSNQPRQLAKDLCAFVGARYIVPLRVLVDEKAQIQALDRSRPLLPMRPGQVERRSHDYVRHGTTALFAALEVKIGNFIAATNGHPKPFVWTKTADEILVRAAHFCKRTSDSGHEGHCDYSARSWRGMVTPGNGDLQPIQGSCYFEKLRTASASVLWTSKTVSSLVICSTSWNFDPKWQSLSAAPWVLAL